MLEAIDLHGGYRGQEVLHGINADFYPGQLTVLLGPNGCGKSTLLRHLSGLSQPTGGQVLLNRQPLSALPPRQRALHIASLPQSRDVPAISARRMVLHGRWPHLGWPRRIGADDIAAADEALSRVGMLAEADRELSSLSGGQRQKVYLAMMLCQATEVLLLDEPTTFLDIGCQLDTWALCRQLAQEGRTVVVVSHEVGQAMRFGDRCHVMQDGCVVESGMPQTLYNSRILCRVFGVELARQGEAYFITGKTREENK